MPRSLNEIAREAGQDWKTIPESARVYLSAMRALTTVQDNYGYDSGKSIVLYFLSNAASWRGDVARRIKAELKEMVK